MSWLAGDLKQWKPQTLCVLRAEAEAENHLKPALTRATRHEFCTSAECRCCCLRVSHDLLGLGVAWSALNQLAYHVSCHEGLGGGGGERKEAGVKRGNARRSSLKERERTIVSRRTLEPFQRQLWGNF